MSARIGLVLALVCASGTAWAQGVSPAPEPKLIRAVEQVDGKAALEANLATVAARGAWTGERSPSREELLGVLLIMSLRDGKGHGA